MEVKLIVLACCIAASMVRTLVDVMHSMMIESSESRNRSRLQCHSDW